MQVSCASQCWQLQPLSQLKTSGNSRSPCSQCGLTVWSVCCKVWTKGKGLDTCYSAAYKSQTHD